MCPEEFHSRGFDETLMKDKKQEKQQLINSKKKSKEFFQEKKPENKSLN